MLGEYFDVGLWGCVDGGVLYSSVSGGGGESCGDGESGVMNSSRVIEVGVRKKYDGGGRRGGEVAGLRWVGESGRALLWYGESL